MHAVAGDVTARQPLGELVGEEHVAQFAVAVGLEELPAVPARSQVSVGRQSLNTTRKQASIPSLRAGVMSDVM